MNLERDLFERIKKGDDKAFGLLFQKNYSQLCTFARDFLKRSEIAEEIVQDVFIKLWDTRGNLNIKNSVRAYLYKMVQNYSLNYIRNNATNKTIIEERLGTLEVFDSRLDSESDNSILDKILSEEAEIDLNDALSQLPEQCRDIFISCRFEGLSYSEIAAKNNISVSTVKTQMGRAMEKLHSALKKHF